MTGVKLPSGVDYWVDHDNDDARLIGAAMATKKRKQQDEAPKEPKAPEAVAEAPAPERAPEPAPVAKAAPQVVRYTLANDVMVPVGGLPQRIAAGTVVSAATHGLSAIRDAGGVLVVMD